MKLSGKAIDNFLKSPNPECYAVLLYGPDTGQISQRAEHLSRQTVPNADDPFRIVELSTDQLKEDPTRLIDELNALSFGGGKRLVRLRDAGEAIAPLIRETLEQAGPTLQESVLLLITAGDLAPKSKLRQCFESLQNAVALPCYMDDARSLHHIIQQHFRQLNLQIEPDAIRYLADICLGDRMIALSEVEKLSLYMAAESSPRPITLNDVQTCTGETTEATLDAICVAAAGGNRASLCALTKRAWDQGAMPITVLRAMQRYMDRLSEVLGHMQQGTPEEQAYKRLRPPIFFKQMPVFRQHLSRWRTRLPRLIEAQNVLYETELACKQSGYKPELQSTRALLRIASF